VKHDEKNFATVTAATYTFSTEADLLQVLIVPDLNCDLHPAKMYRSKQRMQNQSNWPLEGDVPLDMFVCHITWGCANILSVGPHEKQKYL